MRAGDFLRLYLLRHAIAVPRGTPGYPNDDRPLTEEGVRRMTRAAEGVRKVIPAPDVILTSPLVRAHHTARIVARALSCEKKVHVTRSLLPSASVEETLAGLVEFAGAADVMLVGHEPAMGVLAARLLGASRPMLEFKKGSLGAVEIERLPTRTHGRLLWLLTPRQLRSLA